ncbi:MAG: DNA-protecting protein DprA [Candidatus Falkowbacteria bacterium]|nr:MAG: DNA-protecting protein DprA [Candidatus Falkowbacteria bacterium]
MINNKLALLSLAACPYLGPKKIAHLENIFPDLGKIFEVNAEQLLSIGPSSGWINKFINWRQTFSLTALLETLQSEKISYLSWHESQYPQLLKEISSPPPILFYQGNISLINQRPQLAIVGSRKNTLYAEKVLKEFMPELIKSKIIIVSGLALGVDGLAHRQTLINSGLTIAILGSGLKKSNIYPAAHRQLAQEIIANQGLLLSEFPPDYPAKKENFPRRNRLISGLCEAVLLIEAAEKSGSLITAQLAIEQNREVLAIPGNIFTNSSSGTNKLIREGAVPILRSADILEVLKIETDFKNKPKRITKKLVYQSTDDQEMLIYKIILAAEKNGDLICADEIVKKTKLDTATINSKLSILEIKKVIESRNGYFNLSF